MMRPVPLTLGEANALIAQLHRHHKPVVGHRFTIGALEDGKVVGAVVVGRAVARKTDQYRVAEVTRLVTDGTHNACSMLYGAAARAADAMGYDRIQTFILEDEPGTSLKAAGWVFDGMTDGGDWNRPSRGGRRVDQPMVRKQRWMRNFRAVNELMEKLIREHSERTLPPENERVTLFGAGVDELGDWRGIGDDGIEGERSEQ